MMINQILSSVNTDWPYKSANPLMPITANTDKTAMLYKPSEVIIFLDMPSSTLRRYARLFKEHLSPTGQLRRRKYTAQDIEIFEKIKTLSAEGVPIDDISSRLDDMPIEHEPITDKTDQTDQRAIVPINPEVIRQFDNMDDKLDRLLIEIAALRAEVKRPWYQRIFRRPPE